MYQQALSLGEIVLPRPSPFLGSSPVSASEVDRRNEDDKDQLDILSVPVDNANVIEILNLAASLAIPSKLAYGQGQAWKHDESYPDLIDWRDLYLPKQLETLYTKLQDVKLSHFPKDVHDQLRYTFLQTIIAVAKFLPPLDGSNLDTLQKRENQTLKDLFQLQGFDNDWLNPESIKIAENILSLSTFKLLAQDLDYATAILNHYVKPLFSSAAASGKVNPETGRKRIDPSGSNLVLSSHVGVHLPSWEEEEEEGSGSAAWKGIGKRFSKPLASPLGQGNDGIGSWNVLAWCVATLKQASARAFREAQGVDQAKLEAAGKVWKTHWHRILPALMALLEDHEPRFRLVGTTIVLNLLMDESDDEGNQDTKIGSSVPSELLIHTGIWSLLESALHVNLRYINNEEYGAALLDKSVASLRLLILKLSDPIVLNNQYHSNMSGDYGALRMQSLHRLVSEAILSTWSYTTTPSSIQTLKLTYVSTRWFIMLCSDLGVSIRRFIHASLEWLLGWLSLVPLEDVTQVLTTAKVVEAIHVAITTCTSTSSDKLLVLETLSDSLTISISKIWIKTQTSPVPHLLRESNLDRALIQLVSLVSQLSPTLKTKFDQVAQLDSRFKGLIKTDDGSNSKSS